MATVEGSIVIEMSVDDKGVYTVVNRVAGTLRDFQKTANQTATSVKRLEDAHTSLSTKFRHLITTLGALRFAAMDVNDVFLRLPMAILKTAGDLEKTRALLGGLSTQITKTGRDAEAAFNFKYITDMAQKAPFEIAALSDSFVKLKSAGLDPAGGSLQALTDSVAKFGGTGETMKRASVAIQQMLGKGVVSMEELRQQLGEAVPTAMRDMATGMGISMADLTKAVSKGTVEAGDAINKMLVIMSLRNRGAAEEMMTTWNGVQAQLKTRLQLAAEEVAKAGFGDAMKNVVKEISAAMNSVDAKRFTDAFGSSLGAGVNNLVALSKVLAENADLIKTAAIAWAYYKVSSSLVGPALGGIWGQMQNVSKAYKAQTTLIVGGINAERAIAAERAQLAGATARAQMVASASIISTLQAELVAKQALQKQLLASYAPAKKAVMTAPNLIDIAAAQAQVAQIKSMERQNSEAMRKIRSEVDLAKVAHAKAGVDVMKHAGAVDSLHTNVTKATGSMNLMKRAGGMAGAALSALGGWTLALNIAIMAGIYLWMNWGKKAEEAMERSSNARKGLANQKDLEGLMASEQKLVERREGLVRSLNYQKDFGYETGTSAKRMGVENTKRMIKDLDREMLQFSETRIMAQSSVNKQRAREQASEYVRDNEATLAAIRSETIVKKVALDQAFEKEAKAAEGNKKKLALLNTKYGKDSVALELKSAQDAAAASQMSINALSKQFGGVNGDAAKLAATEIAQTIEGATSRIKMAIDAGGPNKILGGKDGDGGPPVISKIQKFIGDLTEKGTELEVALQGVLGTVGKANPIEMALAKTQQRLKDGDFDGTGKKGVPATAAEQQAALNQVKRNEEMKLLLDDAQAITDYARSVKLDYEGTVAFLANPFGDIAATANTDKFAKMLQKLSGTPEQLGELIQKYKGLGRNLIEEVAAGGRMAAALDIEAMYKPVVEKIKGMAPDYAQALQTLANPLGDTDGAKSNQFDEFLAKVGNSQEKLKALAESSGITIEALNNMVALAQEGTKIAATIDLANTYRTVVDENRRMGLEMVEDDRERTRLQMQSENDLAAARMKNRIDEAIARRVDQAEVSRLQSAAAENALLRAEDLRLQARSPLERMSDDWKQSLTKMNDATAQWAGNFVDMISSSATTGKLEFGSFVKSVLADLLKISLQKSLADPLKNIMSEAGGYLKGKLSLGENGTSAARDAFLQSQAEAAKNFARSLADMTERGVNPAIKGLLESISAEGQKTIATGAFTTSLGAATNAIGAFVAALQAGAGNAPGVSSALTRAFGTGATVSNMQNSLPPIMPTFGMGGVPFADGGIMSSMGSIPLRKYAAGGIANSPQMAMFGEGDMNEAYVPLPDGRRIPVAMDGSNAPSVTVNVINQSGTQVTAQKGQPRFDGRQMILDVVLGAATQPGGFRDGMKGAMQS